MFTFYFVMANPQGIKAVVIMISGENRTRHTKRMISSVTTFMIC